MQNLKLNIDLLSLLLVALITKSVISGGTFPIAIAIAAIVAGHSYKLFLNKEKDNKAKLDDEKIKKFEERIASVESKYAMTMGTNRKL